MELDHKVLKCLKNKFILHPLLREDRINRHYKDTRTNSTEKYAEGGVTKAWEEYLYNGKK